MKPTSFICMCVCVGVGVGISVNWVILKFIEKNRYQSHNNMDDRNILCLTGVCFTRVRVFFKSIKLYTWYFLIYYI